MNLEKQLIADTCQSNFWWFVKEAFGVEHNPEGEWLCERIHKPICDWFQMHADEWFKWRASGVKKQKNLLIIVPREFGKTVLITKAGLLWLQLKQPELSCFIGSETKERAIKFLKATKQVISGDDHFQRFTWLYGNWYNKDRVWKEEEIVHALRRGTARSEPSLGAWGIETGLVGMHPDVICLDDPISYERMEANSNWIQIVNEHIASLIPVLKGDGLRIFIGTRYADADFIGRALNRTGRPKSITGMSVPGADVDPDGIWDVYFLAARDLSGKPIYPENWGEERLRESESENSVKHYAQMMNDPGTGDHMALTRQQVDQLWVDLKDVPRNLRISVHMDTAFNHENRRRRGDASCISVWGHARDGSGDVYHLETHGSHAWRIEHFSDQLIMILQRLRRTGRWPFKLTDEMEMGGHTGAWELVLQSWCHRAQLPLPPFQSFSRQGKSKLKRITTAASYWVDGKVRLVRESPGVETLIDQMLKIGVAAFDDYADAAADVFQRDVYVPQRLGEKDGEPLIIRPFDDELKPNSMKWVLREYDRMYKNAPKERYDPV